MIKTEKVEISQADYNELSKGTYDKLEEYVGCLLAMHFLRQHSQHYRKAITCFEEAAIKAMLSHPWPGNVRELDHAVERAVLMAQSGVIKAGDLALKVSRDGPPRIEEMSLEDVECLLIKKALARFSGNVSHAASALGLSRSALYRRLQRYGL
jgi:DNA-binding NtrC family response regulator